MPIYEFYCDNEDGGCGSSFEIELLMCDLNGYKPSCKQCKKTKFMRMYLNLPYVYDSSPRTVGTLAERNTKRTSNDERKFINDKNTLYKQRKFTGSLPDGGSLYPVNEKGERVSIGKKNVKNR